jgi:cytoskeletal protein CcmA (bactofilin family)
MFKSNNLDTSGVSLIGEGLNIEGDLNCSGSIEVAGIMNGNVKSKNLKVIESGSIIGGVNSERLEVFGYVEGQIYADDIFIGKTATIKGDIFFKENLKIDEGADIDGYIKRMSQKTSSSSEKKPTQSRQVKNKTEQESLDIDHNQKKAVNEN